MKRNLYISVFCMLLFCYLALNFSSCGNGGETKPDSSAQNDAADNVTEAGEAIAAYDITAEELADNKLMENMDMTFSESLHKAFELYSYTLELTFPLKKGVASAANGRYPEGTEYDAEGWSMSEEYEVKDAAYIQYTASGSSDIYSVVFYDENHAFISGAGMNEKTRGYIMFCATAEVPEGAVYVRFACFAGFGKTGADMCGDIGGKLRDYWQKRVDCNASVNVACIGDSITEGDHGLLNNNMQGDSYPTFLEKYYGMKVKNYGICGASAITYLEEFNKKYIDISNSDVITVMLGTNMGLTLGGSSQKDAYEELIRRITADMKSTAVLILCTPPHSTENSERGGFGCIEAVENTYSVVYELAEKYDLPVIDILRDSGFDKNIENVAQPVDGLHFGRAGYNALAVFMGTEIAKILDAKAQNAG